MKENINKNTNFQRHLNSLKQSPFLKDSSDDSLQNLLSQMKEDHWKAKSFKNSLEVGAIFYFIVSGKLKVYKSNPETGRAHTVFVLSEGDVFDVLTLLDNEQHDVYWEALEELEVLKIPMYQMRVWIDENPNMHRAILYYLGGRMKQLMDVATDVALQNTLVRLATLLIRNVNGDTQKLQLINNLPNEEIASLIGTTRCVVSRNIQELKRRGAISVSHKNITITSLEILRSISQKNHFHQN